MFTKLYNKIWLMVTRRKPQYGPSAFRHRTWLERAVQDEQFKQAKYQVYGIK
jgi:hypothetical protein